MPFSSFLASSWPRLRGFFCALCIPALLAGTAAADSIERSRSPCNFADSRDALIEAIEAAGLVVATITPFADMLQRTGPALGEGDPPYRAAVVVQFCSARLAWQLVREDPAQLALCPLSIALYENPDGSSVHFAYRRPSPHTPGRRAASRLLRQLSEGAKRRC